MTPAERVALHGGDWWVIDDGPETIGWRMTFESSEFKGFESTMGGKPRGKDVDAFFDVVRETEERVTVWQVKCHGLLRSRGRREAIAKMNREIN